jgi:hypothetical protein
MAETSNCSILQKSFVRAPTQLEDGVFRDRTQVPIKKRSVARLWFQSSGGRVTLNAHLFRPLTSRALEILETASNSDDYSAS